MKNTALYEAWMRYAFGSRDPSRRFGTLDAYLVECAPPADIVEVLANTFDQCATVLARFDDEILTMGLRIMFDPGQDDVVLALKDERVEVEARVGAIKSIHTLYRDCFSRRLDESIRQGGMLGDFVFMLWDVTPLSYWEDHPDRPRMYAEVVNVLGKVLEIENYSCRMSALHGLGHLVLNAGQSAADAIERFIDEGRAMSSDMLTYANIARTGYLE